MRRARMAVAAAAVGATAVVSLHADRTSSLLGGAGAGGPAAAPPTSVPRSGARSTTTVPSPAPSASVRSAVGKSEQYGFGVLAVKVTVRGRHIVDVTVAQLQTDEPTSQSIADQAIPMLRGEVLSAQSAHINAVSGATYTSAGYADSVQSALDQLHVS